MINTVSFDYRRIAEGYAKDRPFLHGQVMERLTNKLQRRYQNGLDVGCGAGLSTRALRQVCDRVTGTDISEEMVRAASALYREPEYAFVQAAGVINWIDENHGMGNVHGAVCPRYAAAVQCDSPGGGKGEGH